MTEIKPIDIIVVSFNRLNFLKKTIESIYERTCYPHRVWVIDNCSPGTEIVEYLKKAKVLGYVYDYVVLPENAGLAAGYSEGFKKVTSEYFITTQDDCLPPDLRPCWLERLIHLMDINPDYCAISMRIQRMRHREVDELSELVESPTSLASVFRIQRKTEMEAINGFGSRPHWESTAFINRAMPLKKKFAVATHLYADHIGFMSENKGFPEGFVDYHTYAAERVKQGEEQPYPEIDPKTNIPVNSNSVRDEKEHTRRENLYKYWGVDFRIPKTHHLTEEQKELAKYCEKGRGLDLGCGNLKCHPNAIGVDLHHESSAEIKSDVRDLWMFKDEELDFVVSSHTLEHMPDFISVLKEWKRVLKIGGVLAVAVPDGEMKKKYILRNGHKNNLGIETLRLVFKYMLKMKIVEFKHVPKNTPNKFVALIAAIKR